MCTFTVTFSLHTQVVPKRGRNDCSQTNCARDISSRITPENPFGYALAGFQTTRTKTRPRGRTPPPQKDARNTIPPACMIGEGFAIGLGRTFHRAASAAAGLHTALANMTLTVTYSTSFYPSIGILTALASGGGRRFLRKHPPCLLCSGGCGMERTTSVLYHFGNVSPP